MQLVTPSKTISRKEMNLLDLVMTGDASRMAGCDRRTFRAWAEKLGIEPIGFSGQKGKKNYREVFKRSDAEKVARAYKAFMASKDN